MERIFRYQPHFRQPDGIVASVFALLLLATWSIPLVVWLAPNMPLNPIFNLAVWLSVTIILIALFATILNRDIRETVFVVSDRRLARATPRGALALSFADVIEYSYRRLPFVKGWAVVRTRAVLIRLPLLIENLPECAALIRNRLLACGNLAAFDNRQIERFIQEARISDAAGKRVARSLRPLVALSIALMLFSGLVAVRLWRMPALLSVAWMVCGMSFPLAGFFISEMLIRRQMRKRMIQAPDTPTAPDTRGIRFAAGLITALAYLLCGIVFQHSFVWYFGL